MYVSLYRRYRPQTFSDVVGQEPAVAVLVQGLLSGKTGQAYLFSGPRGSGKTTLARLLAKAVNCSDREGAEPCGLCRSCLAITAGESLDVMEIDGASNNGVDEVRELKAKVALAPFASPVKVYIIDEVHMLSTAAFNALLKTLEEPPAHVLFILATTEPQKVPVTIRSRCQHIPFRRIAVRVILDRLRHVCLAEGVDCEEEALWEISRQADGALRDALSLLEQALSLGGGKLTLQSLRLLSGGGTRLDLERWASLLPERPAEADRNLREMIASGVSPERLLDGAFILFRDLWICRSWGVEALEGLDLSQPERDHLVQEASQWTAERLWEAMKLCQSLMGRTRLGLRGDILSGLLSASLARTEGTISTSSTRTVRKGRPVEADGPSRRPREEPAPRREPARPRPTAPSEEKARGAGPERARSAEEMARRDEETLKSPQASPPPSEERASEAESGSEPRTFGALREAVARRDPVLAASLLHCRVDADEGALEIYAPPEEPFPFALLTGPRGLCQLAQALREAGFDSGRLHGGGESRELVVAETADMEEPTPFLIPQERRKRAEGDKEKEEPREEASASDEPKASPLQSQVERVLRWTSGDLLVMKDDEVAQSEEALLTEGNPSEEEAEE